MPALYVIVDGLGVGDVEEVVLRDRRALAQEGMLVIIATFDRDKGKLMKNPDIISRGFIYLKENQDIVNEVRKRVQALAQRLPNYREINRISEDPYPRPGGPVHLQQDPPPADDTSGHHRDITAI